MQMLLIDCLQIIPNYVIVLNLEIFSHKEGNEVDDLMWYFNSVVLRGNVEHFAAEATTEAQRNMFALYLTKMTFSPLCYFNHRNVVHLIVFVIPQILDKY